MLVVEPTHRRHRWKAPASKQTGDNWQIEDRKSFPDLLLWDGQNGDAHDDTVQNRKHNFLDGVSILQPDCWIWIPMQASVWIVHARTGEGTGGSDVRYSWSLMNSTVFN